MSAGMRCLVTGADGFIGGHLVEHLLAAGAETTGIGLAVNPLLEQLRARAKFFPADILDPAALAAILAEVQPDAIFHLAAQSLPNVSWAQPAVTFRVNVEGTLNLLDAVRRQCPAARVVVAGSSAEYAPRPDGAPIRETDPLQPSSPYAVSKLAATELARLYQRRYGAGVVVMRPFFLIGPRKQGDVASDFARRIVAIERGAPAELRVGNLDLVRDFLDVRDGVSAMTLLAQSGAAGGIYNICSGRGCSLRELVERMQRLARVPFRVVPDPALVRPVDDLVKIGDPGRLRALGWSPRRDLDATLQDILEYWRAEL